MRKRIRQIASGKFEYDMPALSIPEKLELTAYENLEFSGEFTITNDGGRAIRGIVYSTSPRMECLTPQFEGEKVRVLYKFYSKGLTEGDEEKGSFVIMCNQKQYSLPFCVSVSKLYATGAMGAVVNLSDFVSLAKRQFDQACQIFYHKEFEHIISGQESRERMIYRGMIGTKPARQCVEEFLIGIHKKNPIRIELSQSVCSFEDVRETMQQTVDVGKSEWGYVSIEVSADAPFIELSERTLETTDFLGKSAAYKYMIREDLMHAGWNYGRILFETVYEKKILEIAAHKGARSEEKGTCAQIRECRSGLAELYEAYRLKRIVTGVWTNETVEILNRLQMLCPNDPIYILMKAQAYYINKQKQEAEWILDDFKQKHVDRRSPEWGYYLYIRALMEREPSYVDKMTHEIEEIFQENPDSSVLFFVLLFLKEEYYDNHPYKLRAIEYWIKKGNPSPYLYMEAFYILHQEPYLLAKMGGFERKVLRWAIRRQALTKELAEQIFQIVEFKGFDPVQYEILCAAYEVAKEPEHVGVICSYLIRSQKFDKCYHHWFDEGITLELRITGLYEAYLMSLDERSIGSVPKIIQMYFQYDSTLPYRKLAILYNNVIAEKRSNPETYENYRRSMVRFGMEQVRQGHMDDNLAVIYEEMLELGFINEELAHELSKILFMQKLVIFDQHVVRVIVYQRQMTEPQIVPIIDHVAYFALYSDEYVLLFEDEKGFRYIGSVPYQLQGLMNTRRYLDKCLELAPDELTYVVAHFARWQETPYEKEDQDHMKVFLLSDQIDRYYQAEQAIHMIPILQMEGDDDCVRCYLQKADYAQMPAGIRRSMIEKLVDTQMYELAYEYLKEYGIDQLGSVAELTVADYIISSMEDSGEDEFLIQLAMAAFLKKKYNDVILTYLCEYYAGPIEQMCKLWRAAKQFEIATYELEERIITQTLYVNGDVHAITDIFESYAREDGQELIVLAYLTMSAHFYLLHRSQLEHCLFERMIQELRKGVKLNDACRLAVLSYMSVHHEESDLTIEEELLAEFTGRGIHFAFFKSLDRGLVQKYHLYDKVFLEYQTEGRGHVILHYSRDEDGEDFVQEDMTDVYYGIHVKPFILFFGESVQYYITEEHENKIEVTKSSRITSNDVYEKKDESRYNLINQMLISQTLQEEQNLYHTMKQFEGFDEVTRKVFQIL